jgi:hypothetical protein
MGGWLTVSADENDAGILFAARHEAFLQQSKFDTTRTRA